MTNPVRPAVIALAAFALACSSGDVQSPGRTSVAVVGVTLSASSLRVGQTATAMAVTRDASGNTLSGRTVAWTSSNPSTATVSQSGVVQAVAPGTASIVATSEGVSGQATLTVSGTVTGDIAIVDAQWTQGVQNTAGSIPIILGGNAAVVNVLLRATSPTSNAGPIVLRLLANGALVYSDTVTATSIGTAAPTYAAPSAQFLVPSNRLASGLQWQIVRDPNHVAPDDSASTDVFPRSGTATLATVSVPPLTVRFVPIVLASNGNVAPTILDTDLPQYLRTARSIHPLGEIDAHVGTPLTTAASFGSPPNGGDQSFWTELIAELDAARVADPVEPSSNWFGIVLPPPGFTYTNFGGFSYIPTSATQTGPHTRTSSGIALGWFSRPTQARDNVAHELGHTFGRFHSPCGNPANVDPNYPIAGGTLDVVGHDVYSWENGLATSAATVPVSTGDVMGYCFPVWASTYTDSAILAFRQNIVVASRGGGAAQPTASRTHVLLVRGSIETGRSIALWPTFALDAIPSSDADNAGPYEVQGIAGDGRVLFSRRFTPAAIDHAPAIEHFGIAIPVSDQLEEAVAHIRVTGPEGTAVLNASPSLGASALHAAITVRGVRAANGLLDLDCSTSDARGILIIDHATQQVIGTRASRGMPAVVGAGHAVDVLCSDGVQTRRGLAAGS